MIEIFSSEKTLCLNIRHGLTRAKSLIVQLQKTFCDEVEAAALAKVLEDFLRERIKAFAQRQYNAGWADAKAKRRKRDDYFPGWISPND